MPPARRTATADPLADLRQDDTPAGPPSLDEAPQDAEPRPTFTPEHFREMASEVVVAFHLDTVATGTLHKGGVCACHYLARTALRAALGEPVEPVEVPEVPEEPDTTPGA